MTMSTPRSLPREVGRVGLLQHLQVLAVDDEVLAGTSTVPSKRP